MLDVPQYCVTLHTSKYQIEKMKSWSSCFRFRGMWIGIEYIMCLSVRPWSQFLGILVFVLLFLSSSRYNVYRASFMVVRPESKQEARTWHMSKTKIFVMLESISKKRHSDKLSHWPLQPKLLGKTLLNAQALPPYCAQNWPNIRKVKKRVGQH